MEIDKLMDNLKENKKKVFIFIILFIGLLILIVFIGNISNNYFDKKRLEKSLSLMGEKAYKEFYYDYIKDDIKNYKDGLTITLNDMFNLTKLNSSDYFYNRKTKQACDISNTYVIIYPKDPYQNTDYDLEYYLACGY